MDARLRERDEVLFADRSARRRAHSQRSLRRAAALWQLLGQHLPGTVVAGPVALTVVGSKGKGTASLFASATLAAAGLRVGTLTSPGLRSNRERIRVNGVALDDGLYGELVARLAADLDRHRDALPNDGYLAPTGLFTLMAVRHFRELSLDVMVLEAGMGGGSDEVSLVEATAVAVTAVLGEHLGILGDTVAEIAREKLAVIGPLTTDVVTLTQPDHGVARMVAAAARGRRLTVIGAAAEAGWPPEPVGTNARLGDAAARLVLERIGRPLDETRAAAIRASVVLPGRLSIHQHGGGSLLLDCAIEAAGALAARRLAERLLGGIDTVLLCLPDDKHERDQVLACLEGLAVVPVRVEAPHLHFSGWAQPPMLLADVDLDSLGGRVLCLGTVSFIGEMLDRLDVSTDPAFALP